MEKLFRGKPTDTKPCWQRLDVGKRRMVEQLVAHWVENQALPEAMLDLLACSCHRKCELPNVFVCQMVSGVLISANSKTVMIKCQFMAMMKV